MRGNGASPHRERRPCPGRAGSWVGNHLQGNPAPGSPASPARALAGVWGEGEAAPGAGRGQVQDCGERRSLGGPAGARSGGGEGAGQGAGQPREGAARERSRSDGFKEWCGVEVSQLRPSLPPPCLSKEAPSASSTCSSASTSFFG